jgi:hypothetical protein
MAKDVSAYTDTIEISATDLLTGEEIVFHIAPNSIRRVVLDGASIQLLPATDLYLSQGHLVSDYALRLIFPESIPSGPNDYGREAYSDYLRKMKLASHSHATSQDKANKNRYDQSRFAFEVALYQREARRELEPNCEFVLRHPQARDLLKQLRSLNIREIEA